MPISITVYIHSRGQWGLPQAIEMFSICLYLIYTLNVSCVHTDILPQILMNTS